MPNAEMHRRSPPSVYPVSTAVKKNQVVGEYCIFGVVTHYSPLTTHY